LALILDSNLNNTIFDSYDPLWNEEKGEIELVHMLKTDFDFREANIAV